MVLNKNLREFVELLEKHGVKFLVVGGTRLDFTVFRDTATPRAKDKIDLEELRRIRDAQRHDPQR